MNLDQILAAIAKLSAEDKTKLIEHLGNTTDVTEKDVSAPSDTVAEPQPTANTDNAEPQPADEVVESGETVTEPEQPADTATADAIAQLAAVVQGLEAKITALEKQPQPAEKDIANSLEELTRRYDTNY